MDTKVSFTHVMRQPLATGDVFLYGIYTPGLGFIMVSPKREDARSESGIYRIIRDVSESEILTLVEARVAGWVAGGTILRHRRQFEETNS